MVNERTIGALQKLSTIGLGMAGDSAYNEYKTEQDTQEFEKNLNSLLPEVAEMSNTSPQKMASNFRVNSSSMVTNNIDTNLQYAKDEAASLAGLDPVMYNRRLAEQLLPTVDMIRSLKGAEKSVAMRRFEKEVKATQAAHMTANKQYVQLQTRNNLLRNINTTFRNTLQDNTITSMADKAKAADEQLSELMLVARENGLPDLDAQKLVSQSVLAELKNGNTNMYRMINNSVFKNFIDPIELEKAYDTGVEVLRKRSKAKTTVAGMKDSDVEVLFDRALEEHLKQKNSSLASFVMKNKKLVDNMSPALFKKKFITENGGMVLNRDPSNDAEVYKRQDDMTQIIATMRADNKSVEDVRKRFGDPQYDSVIKAVFADSDNPWANFNYKQSVSNKAAVQPGYEQYIKRSLPKIKDVLAERVKWQNDSWYDTKVIRGLGKMVNEFTDIDSSKDLYKTIKDGDMDIDIMAKAALYESRTGKRIEWDDEDEIDEFISASWNINKFGSDTFLTDKGRPSFVDNVADKDEALNYVERIGNNLKKQFFETQGVENEGQFENLFGFDNENIQYEITQSGSGDRLKIGIMKYPSAWSRLQSEPVRQRIDGMYRIVKKPYNGNPKRMVWQLEMLPKDMYEYSKLGATNLMRTQLEQEGYRNFAVDGSLELSAEQHAQLIQGMDDIAFYDKEDASNKRDMTAKFVGATVSNKIDEVVTDAENSVETLKNLF